VLVAGCGGSKSISASSTPTARVTTPPLTTTGQTTGTQSTVTLTKTTTTPTPSTTTATPTTTATTTTGAINVRVPARFTISADGSVNPRTIAIPAHLPIELIAVSTGGAHRVTLRTARPTTLTVRAHGQAEALIPGLRVGGYALEVDGAAKATLTIGGSPGP
jgi:hypothetical protein